jgi:hypothetical protein
MRMNGVASPALALTGAAQWPPLHFTQVLDDDLGPATVVLDQHHAAFRVLSGWMAVDRGAATVTLHAPRPAQASDIAHPLLWPAAAVFARWRGAETVHAGAFRLPGQDGAWAVLGASGNGKSSLLASLALAGCEVLVDDLVIVEGNSCNAGPRCIDLKLDAAAALGIDAQTTLVRASERRRMALAPCAGSAELCGFIHLGWSASITVTLSRPSENLSTLAHHRRVLGIGANARHIFELAGLPMVRFGRPRSWEAMGESRDVLVGSLGRFLE